jgi:peptidoglycan/LPS O-acetylase OafA/YrhL
VHEDSIPPYLGVGAFSALSGFLALRATGTPLGWLAKRLSKIYPPYWIVLVAIITANQYFHYKSMSFGLVLSQFLGFAYFTHRGQLIGIHTWFISLLILCYGIAAIIRWDRRFLPVFAAIALGLMHREDPKFAGCVLAFLAGGIVAVAPKMWHGALGITGVCLMATATSGTVFAYPLAGVVALMMGALLGGRRSRLMAPASRTAGGLLFEFFLVHGPIYLGLSQVVGLNFFGNLFLGTPTAIVAAWALRRLSRAVGSVAQVALYKILGRPILDRPSLGPIAPVVGPSPQLD